jgi:two-component system, NtrC family, sensor kinase
LIILLARRLMQEAIFQPVGTLRDGAIKIGQGNLDHRIKIFRLDEIGQVAEAFNEMASRLSDREIALKQARDEAMLASQFKSRLLANVGHDLRTPLNSILGYAEILREGVYGSLDERQHKATERIVSNARRLLNLINSILDQAQIEAGKLVLHPDVYNPREILTTVRETMEIPAQTRGVDLLTACTPDIPDLLVGDQQRTQQMVLNLVENALKFTTSGCVTVHIYSPEKTRWAISITDTGPGIAPEAQEIIFEPFQQVDNSTTREKKGVGLGLSIVKQIALLMEGEVILNSKPGAGSTFTILLPLKTLKEAR